MTKPTIGEELLDLKARAGISLSAIARAADYSGASSVQSYFHADYAPDSLDRGVAIRLAKALAGLGQPPITEIEVLQLYRPISTEQSFSYPATKVTEGGGIPVYVSYHRLLRIRPMPDYLLGADPIEIQYDKPKAYRDLPPGINDPANFYATYLPSRSLDPRYGYNDLIILQRDQAPAPGEAAYLSVRRANLSASEQAPGVETVALEFVDRDETGWFFKQLRPSGSFIVPANEIVSAHRIVPYPELLG